MIQKSENCLKQNNSQTNKKTEGENTLYDEKSLNTVDFRCFVIRYLTLDI